MRSLATSSPIAPTARVSAATLANAAPLSVVGVAAAVVVTCYAVGVCTILLALLRRHQAIYQQQQQLQQQLKLTYNGVGCEGAPHLTGDEVCVAVDAAAHAANMAHFYQLYAGRAGRHHLEAFRALSSLVRTKVQHDRTSDDEEEEEEEKRADTDGDVCGTEATAEVTQRSRCEGLRMCRTTRARRRSSSDAHHHHHLHHRKHRPYHHRHYSHTCAEQRRAEKGVACALRLEAPKEMPHVWTLALVAEEEAEENVKLTLNVKQQQQQQQQHGFHHASAKPRSISPPTSFGVSRVTSSEGPSGKTTHNEDHSDGEGTCPPQLDALEHAVHVRTNKNAENARCSFIYRDVIAWTDRMSVEPAYVSASPSVSVSTPREGRSLPATWGDVGCDYEADNEDESSKRTPSTVTCTTPEMTTAGDALVLQTPSSRYPCRSQRRSAPADTAERVGEGMLSASHYSCRGPCLPDDATSAAAAHGDEDGASSADRAALSPAHSVMTHSPTRSALRRATSCCTLSSTTVSMMVIPEDDEDENKADEEAQHVSKEMEESQEEEEKATRMADRGGSALAAPSLELDWSLPPTRRGSPKPITITSMLEIDGPIFPAAAEPFVLHVCAGASSLPASPLTASMSLLPTTHHLLHLSAAGNDVDDDDVQGGDGEVKLQRACNASLYTCAAEHGNDGGDADGEGGEMQNAVEALHVRRSRYCPLPCPCRSADEVEGRLLSPSGEGVVCDGCDTCASSAPTLHEDIAVLFS